MLLEIKASINFDLSRKNYHSMLQIYLGVTGLNFSSLSASFD